MNNEIERACGPAEQSRTHNRKVVSPSLVSANMSLSLGKILNLACLVDHNDIWVVVMGDVTILMSDRLVGCRLDEEKKRSNSNDFLLTVIIMVKRMRTVSVIYSPSILKDEDMTTLGYGRIMSAHVTYETNFGTERTMTH